MTKVGRLYEREKEEYGDLRDARRLVESVDHAAEQLGSLEKACKVIGVSAIDYDKAKRLLEREVVLA